MENRGLRHVVEEAVWILNSAITSTENALMSSFEAIGGSTGASSFGSLSSRKWSLSSSFPSVKSSSSLLQKPRYVIHATMMYIMDIFLCQITTFIKVRLAFAFRLQTLWLIDFTKIYWLKGLKPKNKGPNKLWWTLWFDKNVYLTYIFQLSWIWLVWQSNTCLVHLHIFPFHMVAGVE